MLLGPARAAEPARDPAPPFPPASQTGSPYPRGGYKPPDPLPTRVATLAISVALFGTPFGAFAAGVIFVDAAATGAADGSSWSNAFPDLADALAAASYGDEVRVAGGTYRPDRGLGDRGASFVLPNGVRVLGGYAGSGGSNPDARDPVQFESILSGDIGQPLSSFDNSYHVVRGDPGLDASTLLDGFSIIDGSADGSYPDDAGAGIRLQDAALTVRACRFTTHSGLDGGAAAVVGGSPTFDRCTFVANLSEGNGGGVAASSATVKLLACVFSGNYAGIGGGGFSAYSSTLDVLDCTVRDNAALVFGGGAYTYGCALACQRSTFESNVAANDFPANHDGGGGLYCDGGTTLVRDGSFLSNLTTDGGGGLLLRGGAPTLVNVLIAENTAAYNGGGLHAVADPALRLVNTCAVGNVSWNDGGGLSLSGGTPALLNCTLVFNRVLGFGAGGGIYASDANLLVRNGILWNNRNAQGAGQSAQLARQGGSLDIRYACVQGWDGSWGGEGNWGSDPRFIDSLGPDGIPGTRDDNLRLDADSPCGNAAANALLPADEWDLDGDGDVTEPLPYDLDDRRRIRGGTVDMGAFETVPPPPPIQPGDLNCDGTLNGFDITPFVLALSSPPAYQQAYPACSIVYADINGDGSVNGFDVEPFVALLVP